MENKLRYFIHLHKLHSEQWVEFVESTKYNSRPKLLQTNGHHAQIVSSHKVKSYQPICFIFSCLLHCMFVSDSNCTWSGENNENWNRMCKTEMKKDSVKWKLKWKKMKLRSHWIQYAPNNQRGVVLTTEWAHWAQTVTGRSCTSPPRMIQRSPLISVIGHTNTSCRDDS